MLGSFSYLNLDFNLNKGRPNQFLSFESISKFVVSSFLISSILFLNSVCLLELISTSFNEFKFVSLYLFPFYIL